MAPLREDLNPKYGDTENFRQFCERTFELTFARYNADWDALQKRVEQAEKRVEEAALRAELAARTADAVLATLRALGERGPK
jgi:hypothetical protein